MREYSKKYYNKNKDRIKNKAKKYSEENKERIREYKKKYRSINKDKIKAELKDYYSMNKQKINDDASQHRRTLHGKYTYLKNSAKYRKKCVTISFEEYEAIMSDMTCFYCDNSLQNMAGSSLNRIDSSLGYSIDNVKPCCKICNSIMNKFTLDDLKKRVYKIIKRMEATCKKKEL